MSADRDARLADGIRATASRAVQELFSDVERMKCPATSPEDVLRAVQDAFDGIPDLGYCQASKIARKVIREQGWTPGHDFGRGQQYHGDFSSALGTFWLRAIMRREVIQP